MRLGVSGSQITKGYSAGSDGEPWEESEQGKGTLNPSWGLGSPSPVSASHLSFKGLNLSLQPSQATHPPRARCKPLLHPSTGQRGRKGSLEEPGARPGGARMLELALEGPRRPRAKVKQEASSWPTTGRALGGPVGGWFRSPPHLGLHLAAQALAQPCDLPPGRWEKGCLSGMFSCLPSWDTHGLLLCPPESEFSSPQLPSPLPGAGPPGSRGPTGYPGPPSPSPAPAGGHSAFLPGASCRAKLHSWGPWLGTDTPCPSRPHTLTKPRALGSPGSLAAWRMESKSPAEGSVRFCQPHLDLGSRSCTGEAGGAGWGGLRCGSQAAPDSPACWGPAGPRAPGAAVVPEPAVRSEAGASYLTSAWGSPPSPSPSLPPAQASSFGPSKPAPRQWGGANGRAHPRVVKQPPEAFTLTCGGRSPERSWTDMPSQGGREGT